MKDLKWYWHRQNTVSWDHDNPVSWGDAFNEGHETMRPPSCDEGIGDIMIKELFLIVPLPSDHVMKE